MRLIAIIFMAHLVIGALSSQNAVHVCVDKIIQQDEDLGAIRNQLCKEVSIQKTIHIYVEGLRSLDYSDCPEDFVAAFKAHIDAWQHLAGICGPFEDLRGEMHDIFEKIDNKEFDQRLDHVWQTWSVVEDLIPKK